MVRSSRNRARLRLKGICLAVLCPSLTANAGAAQVAPDSPLGQCLQAVSRAEARAATLGGRSTATCRSSGGVLRRPSDKAATHRMVPPPTPPASNQRRARKVAGAGADGGNSAGNGGGSTSEASISVSLTKV